MSDYWKKKMDELEQSTSKSYWSRKVANLERSQKRNTTVKTRDDDDDLAPIKEDIEKEKENIVKEKEEEKEKTWFQKGAFEDGFSLKNLGKAILGSAEDVIENVGTGIVGMGEKLVDSVVHLAPYYSQSQFYQNGGSFLSEDMQEKQNQAFEVGKKSASEFIQKDLYDEEKVVKQIYTNNTISKQLLGYDPDDISVFGEKSDALAQSAGQLAATAGLQAVGVPWYLTSGITSYGGEVESALKQGATMEEAGVSGLITAGAEILTEKISGGIKFGGKTLDDALVKEIARGVSNKTVRTLMKIGFDAAGEGFEEVLSGAISAVGQKLTYADDKELNELFSKEDAWDAFVGGAVLGGGMSAVNTVKSYKNGVDPVSELTKNEQKVVDKEYKERIAEAEKKGKVSQSEKSKIYDQVLEEMEKGYISTDSIEAALGGETYNNYKSTEAYEKNIQKEFVELVNKENRTPSEQQRYEELIDQVKDIKDKKLQDQIKSKLSDEVKNLVSGDRLLESYNEIERKKQAFQADLTQYDDNQKATVKAAMESGVLNNSNRSHDLVDLAAKVSSDTGVPVKFSDTKKMKEAGLYPKHTVDLKADGTKTEFDLGIKNLDENFKPVVKVGGIEVSNYQVDFKDGKISFKNAPTADVSVTVEGTEIVNAVYANGEIVLNVKSPKYLETLTGHEITHAFEKMNNYENLKNVLKSISEEKGDWETRLKDKQDKYKGIENADAEREVIADLVGEYIFEGSDYIMELSAKDRNVFEKFIDGIKHMLKMVTAGSQEARRLEQAKREFEKVYRELAQKNTADGGAKYSISEKFYDQLNNWDGETIGFSFVVGETSQALQQAGIPKKQIRWDASKISKLLEKHDGMTLETVKQIPELLENPVIVIDSKKGNDSKIVMGDLYDENGKVVTAVLLLTPTSKKGNVLDFFKVSSAEGRSHIKSLFTNADGTAVPIRYVDKKRIQSWLNVNRLQLPLHNLDLDSTTSIDELEDDVKSQFSLSDSTGRQLSKEQADYFKESKVRDENGNLKVMYHGTPNGDFTVFKDGTYFTDNKEYADRYQNPSASSISSGKTASNPKTFEVYLDIKKPFDLSDPEAKRIYIEDYIKGGNAMGINPYLSDAEYAKINTIDWTEGEDLRDFLTENGYDYDGLVLDEGADGGYGDEVKSRGTSYVVFSPEQVKNVDNGKPTTDPDIRFSLSEAVEETKELMAIHNLHSSELLKQLQMGGMPYPSIAITKPEMISHDNFGEVSIILNKDAIDPKKSKYNKVYSADAYTPTFPNVDYEASEEAVSRIAGTVNKWYNQIPDYYQRSVRSLRDYDNINDELNRWGGEQRYIEKYVDDDGLKQVYLAENGGAVPVEMKSTETRMTDYQMKLYQMVTDKMGEAVLKSFNEKGSYDKLGLARMAWLEKHGDALKDIYAEEWASDGTMTKAEALEIANEQNRLYWRDEIRRALEFIENGGVTVTETEDIAATKAKINERIANSDYSNWVEKLFSGIEGRSGIRNSKDIFTPSGTRRSFAQTHDPLTIDNIVKAMRKENQTGQGAFGSGSILGASAKEFGSIAEIKRNAGNLGKMDKAEHDAITDRIQDTFWDISRRYAAGKDVIDAQATLAEAVSKSESKAGIARYLKQYDYVYKYDDSIVDEIVELRDYIRSLPTPYFEAKPRRGVGFDEVAVFVIPYDADVKLKQELLNRGYNIAEYDPKVEGDRQRVVNQFEEYKFSLSDAGNQPQQSGFRATLGKDVALEAPVQEEVAPVQKNPADVAKNDAIAAEEMFPDDTAPIQEEYERLLEDRDDIVGAMDAFAAVGDYASAEQLMPEYEAVQTRIAEIEADDADRFASIDDADAPPEMDNTNPEDVADNVPLTKTLVSQLAKDVRSQLGLPANRVAEVRELIERYNSEEFPSKAHLYTEIQERFGTITEKEVNEDLKGIKSLLRTYGINVDESIKAEIPDYAQMMRSNFGKVRFSKEGLPVDVAYKEFAESLPGYFPESIYVPTDQLMRIIEVANMDTTMETEYEIDWQTLENVTDSIMNGVAEFKQNRKENLANRHGRESFQSLMESADQYAPPISWDVAPVRPAIKSVQADPDDIAPVYETSSGQQALMPEVEVPKKITRKELHQNIMDDIKTTFRESGFEFDNVLKDAKNLSTFATVDNTPQRVMEKALGYKEGQVLSDLTVNKVAQNETDGIRWLNSFTDKKSGLLAKISKQYGIKPGSKASAAAQMYAEGFYVGENDAIIAYGDKELAADFPNEKVRENIKKLARDPRIRQIYDETLAAINESRTRNAYPEIPRLDNYFLHFRAMEDTFSRLGLPFNPNDIRAKDLPTDLNGVTADLKPGQPYFASAKHRTGKRTSFDLLGGLENYLTSAKNQIYHIDDIQTLRALRNYVAETYGQATGLQDLDLLSDEEAEQRIHDVYNSHLSTFAKFLNEEANVLAGKTSLIDRGLEGVIGRRGITFLDTLNKQVGANMVGFNVSSSLTNFLAPVQAFAKTNKADFVKAMAQTAYNKMANVVGKGDSFVEESPVMIRRKGAERFYRTPYQKVADKGYVLMGVVDDISTELIARTKYNELTRKGMDSQKAHYETDKWVSRLMGDRSLGQQPQLYNSKMLGLFTKFQLEVRNQLDSQFYDTIQEAKVSAEDIENGLLRNAKKAAKITSTFAQLAVMQHLFGKAFESVAGYNPAFDIIEALIKTFGWDDEEESEDTVLDNIEEGFLSLLGDLPYTSTLTGGRIPIASALPVTEFIKGEDQYGNEKNRWQTLGEAAPYYVLPGGYGQIKKTKAGMEMFDDDLPIAGSYTDSGNLRFPVEDTAGNRVQAALFGQWASENARDYFDNERKPLQEKQTQEFISSGMKIQDYWDYREGLAKQDKLEDKADYIDSLDLPISTKNMLVNNVANRKEAIDMTDYGKYGSLEEMDFATKNPEKYEVALAVGGYKSYMTYQEDMKGMKLAEKADYIAGLNRLVTQQKNLLINSETDRKEPIDLTGYENFSSFEEFEFAKKNPESYAMAKTVGGYKSYTEYSDALGDIKADKDQFGNSISGSRKTKVVAYINSLNIPVTQKYILLKSEYPSTDDYNYEIIDYVNSMDDMTFEEKIEVLRKLDFDVDAAGNIYW